MRGTLCIDIIRVRDQRVVDRRETRNLVMTAGYDELIRVLGGTAPASHFVSRMQFGTGGTAPAAGDASLSMPITPIKDIATVTYPTGGDPFRIIFEAFLLSAEGNGFLISEAGLYSVASILVARAVFPSVAKTSDHALHATWQVND